MLRALQQSVKATQDQVRALAVLSAEPEPAEPSAEEIARDEARGQRRRERLMLDVPEDQRIVLHHERWLWDNQEELSAIALELEHLEQLSAGSVSQ